MSLDIFEKWVNDKSHIQLDLVIWSIPTILITLVMFCCSVAQLCLTLWDLMLYSTPSFPDFHYHSELAQTHVHWASDAIQPSHPLLSPSSPAFLFPSIRVFSSELILLIRWPKHWSFSFSISPSSGYSGLISFRIDWLDLQSKGFSRVLSNTTV